MAAFGSPVLDSRMKYRGPSGPVVVTSQVLMVRWKSSAVAWYSWERAVSP